MGVESEDEGEGGSAPTFPGHSLDPPYKVVVKATVQPLPNQAEANATQILQVSSVEILYVETSESIDIYPARKDLSKREKEIWEKAKAHLADGSLTLKLDMPGVVVSPQSIQLRGQPVRFLIRPTENKDGSLEGQLSAEGTPDQMYLDFGVQYKITMQVKEHYSRRESISWFYAFTGSGFTLTGILGFLSGTLFKRGDSNSKSDSADTTRTGEAHSKPSETQIPAKRKPASKPRNGRAP
jgi:hypothetical protein